MDVAFDVIEAAKPYTILLGTFGICVVYPLVVLFWTCIEGHAAADGQASRASSEALAAEAWKSKAASEPVKKASAARLPLQKRVRGLPGRSVSRSRLAVAVACAAAACVGTLVAAGRALGFAVGAPPGPLVHACALGSAGAASACRGLEDSLLTDGGPALEAQQSASMGGSSVGAALAGVLALAGAAAALGHATRRTKAVGATRRRAGLAGRTPAVRPRMRQSGSSGLLRHSSSYESMHAAQPRPDTVTDFPDDVTWYTPPFAGGVSMWHHVDLHVKSWLDEDTGLYHYVNEIPKGALQKFELQTRLEQNIIREDPKGSSKLQAFGQPVPFNYGCFPQTYRDPKEYDELHNAPGDDDPLDVIDLTTRAVAVGVAVACRPLGAVCLIDEGQADWKILVVSTEAEEPLAAAMSIEEVERLAPGRIEQALKWMDDFKEFSSHKETTLHYHIHGADVAKAIIEKDHKAWSRLLAEADASGLARGHWVRGAKQAKAVSSAWSPQTLGVPGELLHVPSKLVGAAGRAAPAPAYATSRGLGLTMRRQVTSGSEGGEGGEAGAEASSDAETGF